jgi:putative ABC transport system permease protein
MLQLKHIVKDYAAGATVVHALKGIDLQFRESEFVAVLGHSGCGKTTLLNIIGGLDHYTSGDLVINGKSTKDFSDGDWDTYRNHSVGFVFQTYNLIPHQTVLSNVELALTLSGVSKAERRRRAVQALTDVGLGDQLNKKPNQMSGGQMQRVAIARALVNDPDILLADEPTGALDSETSVQVMEILKRISQNRLIIMVTHNPELAETYATRIVRIRDGEIVSDSDPFTAAEDARSERAIGKKPSMRFPTALGLSMNNLMTKKWRTFLTAFAGSIGIIGIALILSLSNGIQTYIDQVQEDTLSSYPITLEAERLDMSGLVTSLMGVNSREEEGEGGHELDAVYSNTVMYDLMSSLSQTQTQTNNLAAFKEYLEQADSPIKQHASAIRYSYGLDMKIYAKDSDGTIFLSDVTDLLQTAMASLYGGDYSSYFDQFGAAYSRMQVWEEMLPPQSDDAGGGLVNELLTKQYDLLYGHWPEKYDEAVLIVNKDNEISDLVIYCMGLGSQAQVTEAMKHIMAGEETEAFVKRWDYADICNTTFKILLPAEYYQYDSLSGSYSDVSKTGAGLDFLYNAPDVGTTVKIVGILRPDTEAVSSMMQGAIGYTTALTDYLVERTAEMEVLQKQKADPETDVLLGLPFLTDDYFVSDEQKKADITEVLRSLPLSERAAVYVALQSRPDEDYLDSIVSSQTEGLTREAIEAQVTDSYAQEMGVDAATLKNYIAGMDDETLFAFVADAVRQQVTEQYAAGVEARLGVLPAEQLAALLEESFTAEPEPEEAPEPEPAQPEVALDTLTPEALLAMAPEVLAALPPDVLAALPQQLLAMMGPAQLEAVRAVLEAAQAQANSPETPKAKALTAEQYGWLYDTYMPPTVSESSYEENLKKLGDTDFAHPSAINLYAASFADKDAMADLISQYNDSADEDDRIEYTDIVALLMSSITTIINAISYVLIAFVAISLVVSSIMIGIITYISVLERTKEIGILRAIGASKRDISRVFNAETLIEGLCSGVIGIGVTLLLIIPINLIVHDLTGIRTLNAILPPLGAVILVLISMALTFIAGLIPSGIAARKDPVEALRTE